ncbi:MAG: hypothetical protein IH937_14660 [Acidobacteria bacterium]|nr:hypothetical protein [Acidobacteriota bacterium]
MINKMSQNRSKQARPGKRKAPRTAWKPGQSGNPGGRPKELAQVKALARQHTQEALETLAKLMKSGSPDRTKVAAAEAILDRAWGRPTQAIDHGVSDGQDFEFTINIGSPKSPKCKPRH